MTQTNQLKQMADAVIEAQPFSKIVGIKVISITPEEMVFSMPIRHDLTQHLGFVHGGAIASLIDIALTFAGGFNLGGRPVVTSEYKLNFVRPGVGEELIAKSFLVHAGKTQAVTRCDVYAKKDGVEKLCATAQGTIVLMGQAKTA